jgi:tRNA threonylcarbamoyladenosine biosynthesis protein TsaE
MMMRNSYTINSLENIYNVAEVFLKDYPHYKVLAFRGAMGVGKTTFIKALCNRLGVDDTVNSPSFSIVNEYDTLKGDKIFHFDFYRIRHAEEAFDMGYEDYLYSGAYCFLEWPEKIEALLPTPRLELNFEEGEDHTRIINVVEFP